ncbi:DUF5926 family protein [Aldersonia sp. NBC_00410]|uniref:DUF5926 family protein n=1 Tax=Aldersonia sp. NBC_00410 TaxID=2975954 RepID=UPI002250D376|nr:DUF5926 family protein [Aldersonia sp. NBC_00410]MCX5045131.1 DUF5926 family protein [Aldersonia sp. NBC_00410]
MAKKSKRNTPKPGSNRSQRIAERRAEHERLAADAGARPFAGLAAECDLVAMREFVPSAVAQLPTRSTDRTIQVATVLPGAVAALVREHSGATTGVVAVQTQAAGPDPAADLASAVKWAMSAEAGQSLDGADPDEDTPALTDLIDPAAELDVSVYNDFNWWIPEGATPDAEAAAAVERANQVIMPSARLDGLAAAWWVDAGEKAHLRWVRPEDEDDLMLALARVHAQGALHLGEGSRFAGSFRTHGVLVPVFDLDPERHPTEWTAAATEFDAKLGEALAVDAPLTSDERRSRDGLRSRQVTLR